MFFFVCVFYNLSVKTWFYSQNTSIYFLKLVNRAIQQSCMHHTVYTHEQKDLKTARSWNVYKQLTIYIYTIYVLYEKMSLSISS